MTNWRTRLDWYQEFEMPVMIENLANRALQAVQTQAQEARHHINRCAAQQMRRHREWQEGPR